MSECSAKPDDKEVFALRVGVRLQFERAQKSWVLLYPEGVVQLSDTAAAILRRLDGLCSTSTLIRELDSAYNAETRSDVLEFLETAYERRWIERR